MQIALAIFINTNSLRQGGSRTQPPRCFSSFKVENTSKNQFTARWEWASSGPEVSFADVLFPPEAFSPPTFLLS